MFGRYNKAQQAVLETTLRIIIQKELQATSMALIAKESGVSTGNIYHYFRSKEDIVNELYRAIVTFNGDFVIQGLNQGKDIRQKFELGWGKVIELSRMYPQGFQFIEQYSFSPYINEEIKKEAYTGGWCAPMNKLYQDAMDEGLFIALDPQLAVQMHYGSIVFLMKGHLQGQFELTDAFIRQLLQSSWNSVSRTPWDAGES
ncbi:TetR/AcrR family transcriptional regulator [Paenibacillus thalictri]|uniref:TetR/AcrR family transcriptional regulator n=1 Tax=Paenibacillus thalictri TaxID=2527873 RepID=A0A4Q9DYR5_9BACL|nr:TetR/AcrR family transcriptional regulator [Paenibacillus thalictri]TBL81053.1 TetR/AcrR family transcriptional regulator [Paenibacillus thalictri]